MGFAELRESYKEESNNNNTGAESNSNGDYEERPYGRMFPYGVISFDDIIEVFYPDDIWDDGPVTDSNGDIGVVLKGPHVVDGQLYRAQGRGDDTLARKDENASEYIDYYVVNVDANDGSKENYNSDGVLKGVDPSKRANEFVGERVDSFEEDEMTVWLSGSSGKWAGRYLDVNGGPEAKYEDGSHTQGLVETNPDKYKYDWEDEEYPDVTKRFARLPQMRDIDFEEHGGGFIDLVHMSDRFEGAEYGYYVTIGLNDFEGDNVQNATMLETQTNPDAVEYQDAALVWHDEPESDDSNSGSSNGDDQGFQTAGTDAFDVPDEDRKSRTEFLDDLSVEVRRFVHSCVVDCDIRPGEDPLHTVAGGDMDQWMGIVDGNYGGDRTVDEKLSTELNDLCEIYATIVDGDIEAARDAGVPVDN